MKLEQIMDTAIANKASDIHLAYGLPPIVRINGKLLKVGEELVDDDINREFAMQLLGERLYRGFDETGECDAGYSYNGIYNFRVNVFNQKTHVGIVLRLIPYEVPTLDSLKLPEVFRSLCMLRRGLILVTGPTGSGKTTTLAAMIDYMSRTRNEHILTIEDPIEFIFPNGNGIINQRQLGSDTQSFAGALHSALREDIDIVMVGEMRDLDTISAAVTAAETGHLVVSTLHTIGSAKTIERVIDVFPPTQQSQIRTQLSSVLQAVISQQLVPNVRNDGRQLALEIMIATHAIQNLIREDNTSQMQNQIQMGAAEGMITMDQSLINLYRSGLISQENLKKFCVEPRAVERFCM